MAILTALIALALKLPQAVIALLPEAARPAWVPVSGATVTSVLMGLGWLAFGAALLWLRRWLGLISTLWFCVVSMFSGIQLALNGYLPWGGWQAFTGAVATVAVVVAAVRGAFAGSRW